MNVLNATEELMLKNDFKNYFFKKRVISQELHRKDYTLYDSIYVKYPESQGVGGKGEGE